METKLKKDALQRTDVRENGKSNLQCARKSNDVMSIHNEKGVRVREMAVTCE